MDKVGEKLPHKSASEIIFFYHTFKKAFNLKTHIKNYSNLEKYKG